MGNAVIRNKIKRQVREMVHDIYTFDENFDTIILVRPKYHEEVIKTTKNSWKDWLKKLKYKGKANFNEGEYKWKIFKGKRKFLLVATLMMVLLTGCSVPRDQKTGKTYINSIITIKEETVQKKNVSLNLVQKKRNSIKI